MATGAIAEARTFEAVQVTTTPCVVCNATHVFVLEKTAYDAWQEGKHVQDAFPDLIPENREILISGTCPRCWDTLWNEEEEDA